jgi:hypothetical protein
MRLYWMKQVMPDERKQIHSSPDTANYQIRIEGHLGQRWAEWFDGMSITPEADGNTLLAGSLPDQAALHGLLKKMRDMGITLVSINRIDAG